MFTEQQLLDNKLMSEVMIRIARELVPVKTFHYLAEVENRKLMVEQIGPESFLIPDETKLPLKDPESGEYNCDLIYAARLATKSRGEKDLYEQATSIYEKCKCNKKIEITVEGHNDTYDLLDILDLMEIEFKNEKMDDMGIQTGSK